MAYKTPDVYVEEISLFPPSVAEVETAVPAFIGYTGKADEFGPDDLKNTPTKITSLLEYQSLFGGSAPVQVTEIVLDENSIVSSSKIDSTFYMYDSLRMFFKNGGGKCYIISVGSYDDDVTKAHFEAGLSSLKKQDEPTIILFPDAVLLENDLYDLQQQVLKQCNNLQDRFGVFDLLESNATDATFDWEDGVNGFRDSVGINYLKYGAAYTPWLKSNLGIDISYRDVKGKIYRGGNLVALDILTDDTGVKTTVSDLDKAIADVDKLKLDVDALKDTAETLKTQFVIKLDAFKSVPSTGSFKALITFIYDIIKQVDAWAGSISPVSGDQLKADVTNSITNSMKASMEKLIAYDKGANSELTGSYNLYEVYDPIRRSAPLILISGINLEIPFSH